MAADAAIVENAGLRRDVEVFRIGESQSSSSMYHMENETPEQLVSMLLVSLFSESLPDTQSNVVIKTLEETVTCEVCFHEMRNPWM